jgi:hypothetical protein
MVFAGIHSVNNALQAKVLTKQDVIQEIKHRFQRTNAKLKKKNSKPLEWSAFLEDATQDGFYPADVNAAMEQKNYTLHSFNFNTENKVFIDKILDEHGARVVYGRYDVGDSKSMSHAIGVHNGFLIESSITHSPQPYKMSDPARRWPDKFTPTLVTTIYENGAVPNHVIAQMERINAQLGDEVKLIE